MSLDSSGLDPVNPVEHLPSALGASKPTRPTETGPQGCTYNQVPVMDPRQAGDYTFLTLHSPLSNIQKIAAFSEKFVRTALQEPSRVQEAQCSSSHKCLEHSNSTVGIITSVMELNSVLRADGSLIGTFSSARALVECSCEQGLGTGPEVPPFWSVEFMEMKFNSCLTCSPSTCQSNQSHRQGQGKPRTEQAPSLAYPTN